VDTKELFGKILTLLEENNKMLKELTELGNYDPKVGEATKQEYKETSAIINQKTDEVIGKDDKVTAWYDESTRLMWEVKQPHNMYYTYSNSEAEDFAVELNSNNYSGFNDWRIPTKEELRTLLTKDKNNGSNLKLPLSQNGTYNFWSSTKYDENFFWIINFKSGKELKSEKNNFDYVRLVRKVE